MLEGPVSEVAIGVMADDDGVDGTSSCADEIISNVCARDGRAYNYYFLIEFSERPRCNTRCIARTLPL